MINVQEKLQAIEEYVYPTVDFILKQYPQLQELQTPYEVQCFMEEKFCKKTMNQLVQDMLFPEDEREDAENFCQENGLDPKIVFEVFAELSIHRRMTATDMLNSFKSRFESEEDCIKFFDTLIEKKMLTYKNGMFIVNKNATLSDEQIDILDFCISNPVMLVKPKKIRKNHFGNYRNGYLTLGRGIFSKKATPHTEVPTDFLDKQNSMPYWINYSVWDHYIKYHPEIPEREADEDDNKYTKKVEDALIHHTKKWMYIELLRRIGVEKVYIPNMYCYRGRNHPIAYLINPQGQDTDKGLLAFEPQPITEKGMKWLAISIANCFNAKIDGVDADKCTFDKRESWFYEVIQPKMWLLEEEFIEWLNKEAEKADSPACFWSQVHNMWWIQKNMREGKEALVWAITHFDATCSGYQIQAIFAKDWRIAELCNLIDPKSRKDLYTTLYNELIAAGLPNTFTRLQIKKQCFIPAIYNGFSTIVKLFQEQEYLELFNDMMNKYSMWKMNRKFPGKWRKDIDEYSFWYPDAFKVYHKIFISEKRSIEFQGIEVYLNYKVQTSLEGSCQLGPNITHGWDGYIARELSRAMTFGTKNKEKLLELHQNKSYWAINNQFVWSQENLESRETMKKILALGDRFKMYSLRILTEANALNIDLIPDEVFEELFNSLPNDFSWVSEIHDSFGVCPNQAEELMEQYRLNLYRLAKSKALPCVMEDYLGYYPEEFDFGRNDEFAEAIKNSVYALC